MPNIQDASTAHVSSFIKAMFHGQRSANDDVLNKKIAHSIAVNILHNPEEGLRLVEELVEEITLLRDKNKALEATSLTDYLTGAYNRRYFQRLIETLETPAGANYRRITNRHYLVMIDLDDFKQINDTYGHAAGDKALCHVVESLRMLVRKSDCVCRIGGDEFVVLLKDATPEGAYKKILELVAAFKTMTFDYDGKSIPVMASIGHGEINPKCFVRDVIREVDRDLYVMKKSKNKNPKPVTSDSCDTLQATSDLG
jgi:diguanylate cyclase (GGDEF)-like protein